MDPTLVVIGFVVLLAALLYYMYKDQRKRPTEGPRTEKKEPTVVKARDYEAQMKAVEPQKPKLEPKPEPVPEPMTEPKPEPESDTGSLENLSGIGEKYRALLKASGVDTLLALASWDAKDLLERLKEVNGDQQIVKRSPPLATVEDWIKRAGEQAG
ncbi:hypothetical protein A3K81_05780 [Candidatus Bathyarchaeota archaeon RBG_13_60_20]|nr:MAG: hypothetical protein A3K81_05780 [Candidatus Bathyarchaeota archaeon RBG_13_60_20]